MLVKPKKKQSQILSLRCALPGRSAGTESEIPWIPRCSDEVELGWGVGQWLGSQILGGVDIVNIKIYPFSQTLGSEIESQKFKR